MLVADLPRLHAQRDAAAERWGEQTGKVCDDGGKEVTQRAVVLRGREERKTKEGMEMRGTGNGDRETDNNMNVFLATHCR